MKFKLRFSENKITYWADRAPDLTELQKIGQTAQKRGYLVRNEFLRLCQVKSPRPKLHYEKNSALLIKDVTQIAFSAKLEQIEIQSLMILSGVKWPVASYILHFCSKRKYPVLDERALWSLSIEQTSGYTYEFWQAYTAFCRDLAMRNKVSMRELDSALWQFSKENQ